MQKPVIVEQILMSKTHNAKRQTDLIWTQNAAVFLQCLKH